MKYIFLGVFFLSHILYAAESGRRDSPTDFSIVRVLKHPGGKIIIDVSNEADGTREKMEAPAEYFSGVTFDTLTQEEVTEHITFLRAELAQYELLEQEKKEPRSAEHHMQPIFDEHADERSALCQELLNIRVHLKSVKKPHRAQRGEGSVQRELTNEEMLIQALKDKFAQARPGSAESVKSYVSSDEDSE